MFTAGDYVDKQGKTWFCLQRYLPEKDTISCNCRDDHSFTAANVETFNQWGWTKK